MIWNSRQMLPVLRPTAPHRSNSNSNIHGYVKKILIVHDFDDDDDDDESSWED